MREILFRGKRLDNGEWVHGYFTKSPDETLSTICKKGTEDYTNYVVGPETVGQFTNLNDKHNNPIYEGDILRGIQKEQDDKDGVNSYPLNDIVKWREGGFSVFSKPLQDAHTREGKLFQFMWVNQRHHATPSSYWQIDDIEIIGNIYENKDLLNNH